MRVGVLVQHVLAAFLLCLGSVRCSALEDKEAEEYQVKAVFLLNFARYVEWPPDIFRNSSDPIRLCVLGENPFDTILIEAVRGKKIGERVFQLQAVYSSREASSCHILFVGSAEQKRTRGVLQELRTVSILTVGEAEDFVSAGGIIRFKLKDARVRFDINANAAAQANLRISSKLMSLAENTRKQ